MLEQKEREQRQLQRDLNQLQQKFQQQHLQSLQQRFLQQHLQNPKQVPPTVQATPQLATQQAARRGAQPTAQLSQAVQPAAAVSQQVPPTVTAAPQHVGRAETARASSYSQLQVKPLKASLGLASGNEQQMRVSKAQVRGTCMSHLMQPFCLCTYHASFFDSGLMRPAASTCLRHAYARSVCPSCSAAWVCWAVSTCQSLGLRGCGTRMSGSLRG